MSFHINSDKEKIRGVNPKLIGDNEATIRIGTGSNETEVLRTQLDPLSGLPRVGIIELDSVLIILKLPLAVVDIPPPQMFRSILHQLVEGKH